MHRIYIYWDRSRLPRAAGCLETTRMAAAAASGFADRTLAARPGRSRFGAPVGAFPPIR